MDNFNDGILLDSSNYIPRIPFSNPNTNSNRNDNIYSQLQSELKGQGFSAYNGNSLSIDGIPGKLTHSACPLVREGARGNITIWIQLRVGAEPDGIFGENTKNAVKYFQEHRGISADGIVGKNTWSKLLGI